MSELASEQAATHLPKSDEVFWAEQSNAGLREIASRHEQGIEVKLLWREIGNMVILGAANETGERALTMVAPDEAMESLQHPAQYFSHETSNRIFNQAA